MSILSEFRLRYHKRRVERAGVMLAMYHELTHEKESKFIVRSPEGKQYSIAVTETEPVPCYDDPLEVV